MPQEQGFRSTLFRSNSAEDEAEAEAEDEAAHRLFSRPISGRLPPVKKGLQVLASLLHIAPDSFVDSLLHGRSKKRPICAQRV